MHNSHGKNVYSSQCGCMGKWLYRILYHARINAIFWHWMYCTHTRKIVSKISNATVRSTWDTTQKQTKIGKHAVKCVVMVCAVCSCALYGVCATNSVLWSQLRAQTHADKSMYFNGNNCNKIWINWRSHRLLFRLTSYKEIVRSGERIFLPNATFFGRKQNPNKCSEETICRAFATGSNGISNNV